MHAEPEPEHSAEESYELQVYAQSPVAPSPRRLAELAGSGGLPIELDTVTAPVDDLDSCDWTRLAFRSAGASGPSVTVTLTDELPRLLDEFREDRAAGEEVPEGLFAARRLYVLDLPDDDGGKPEAEDEDDEAQQAALVLVAWALAEHAEGLLFDPQEEFFADAESFWALVMDESAGAAAAIPEPRSTNRRQGGWT